MGAGNFSLLDSSIFDEVLASSDFSGGAFGGEEYAEQLGQGNFGGGEEGGGIDWATELGEMSKALKGMNQVKTSVGKSNLLRRMMQDRAQSLSGGGTQMAGPGGVTAFQGDKSPEDIEIEDDIAEMLMQRMGL